MKTKHLFFTMALAGIFAACTNDDFLENGPAQGAVAGQERPTISGVTLNIDEANTRVVLGSNGYQFEEGDVISALLMDENNTGVRYGITTNTDEWNKLTWLEKYHLVDYVHTNFPFVRKNGVFASDCNMLEGNYFLTYPYVCLDGNRQGRIDIAKQVQIGDESADRARTIAENQYFIGYAQLEAGEGASDFKAQLVPVLAPVRIALTSETNVGTTLHVTKLVLSHPKLTGTLMIDPTRAKYADPMGNGVEGWNLWQDYVKNHTDEPMTSNEGDIWHFNYANYLANQPATADDAEWQKELYYNERYGSTLDMDYVYNVTGEAGASSDIRLNRKPNTYYWDDAIRAAVQPMREFNNPEYATQYVEVYLKDTEDADCMVLAPNSTIEAVMMLPAFQGDESPLMLSIYTKEGIIKNINLSKQHTGNGTDVKTSGILDRFDPTDKQIQRVEVTIDNPAVVQYPTNVTINNEDDLLQWVNWLNEDPQNTGNKNPIATFTNDITINDELAAAIEQLDDNYILSIVAHAAPGNNLRIATSEDHANILERLDVASNVTVEVMEGAVLNMTKDSYNVKHEITSIPGYPENPWGQLNIEVADGGKLNIVSNDKTAIQGGYDAAGQPVANRTEVRIENKGTIDVQNVELLGFYIVNEGEMNLGEGTSLYFAPKSVNTIKGTIDVRGLISGTIENNFENKGVINNYNQVRNIQNLGNDDNKLEGTINIMGWGVYTDLSVNSGVVDYHEFLTGVNINNTIYDINGGELEEAIKGGVFKYTGPAGAAVKQVDDEELATDGTSGLQVGDLVNAYVTDAVITSGILSTNYADVTTLKNLTINAGAGIAKTTSNDKLYFVEDIDQGTLVLEGGKDSNGYTTTVDGVYFYNVADVDENVVVKGEGVTFKGQYIGFYKGDTSKAGVYFETAAAKVVRGCTLYAESLYSVDGTRSNIYNDGTIQLEKVHDNQVTVHTNTPQVVGQ